jgi:hypothetical protein
MPSNHEIDLLLAGEDPNADRPDPAVQAAEGAGRA